MRDLLGRPLHDLRISVTDRCNLRCPYCMPREHFGPGYAFLPPAELLSFAEIARVARAFCANGVRKIRLTGGEPLLRPRLEQLVAMLRELPDVGELALTTNGVLLARRAQTLKDAGLDRVTVSLDALDPAVFRAMSDAPLSPERVLEAIDVALAAKLVPIKVNMVVRRGVNAMRVLESGPARVVWESIAADGTTPTGHTKEWLGTTMEFDIVPAGAGTELRFIEYMDVGATNGWRAQEVVPAAQILREIEQRWPLERTPPVIAGEVASRYRYTDGAGEIGVIHSVSNPFCATCTRARLSADGRVHTCLFAEGETDMRALLRGGASDRELAEAVGRVWQARSDRYSAERSTRGTRDASTVVTPAPEMSYIGG